MGGRTITYTCPMDEIPVFVRDGSAIPINLNEALRRVPLVEVSGGVGNDKRYSARFPLLCPRVNSRTIWATTLSLRRAGCGNGNDGGAPCRLTQPGSHVQLFGRGILPAECWCR